MRLLDALVVKILPIAPSRLVRVVASRYVDGETLEDAVRTVRQLNAEGCVTDTGSSPRASPARLRALRKILACLFPESIEGESRDRRVLKGLLSGGRVPSKSGDRVIDSPRDLRNHPQSDGSRAPDHPILSPT
jgi:hypothetical protein